MERVKIKLPSKMDFFIEEKIRVSDLNYGNHLGNDSVLSLLHQGRMEFFASFGWSEMNLGGAGIIMADSAVEYKAEGFMGEKIRIYVGFGSRSSVGFELLYLIEKEGGEILAKARTGMVCFDYEKRKIISIPEEVVKKIDQ